MPVFHFDRVTGQDVFIGRLDWLSGTHIPNVTVPRADDLATTQFTLVQRRASVGAGLGKGDDFAAGVGNDKVMAEKFNLFHSIFE
jgi:hypothetical protein